MEWKEYWEQYPTKFKETEFFKQVGKTVSGQPITSSQFEGRISDIQKALNITADDLVLDMCCGNGVITAEIAKACKMIVGIDFSDPLIKIARKYNNAENINYICASILDKNINTLVDKVFTKVYMYESLQHFNHAELPNILELISEISMSHVKIFLGGIPDSEKIWNFYNTDEKREEYRIRKSENREAIGTWWDQKNIADVCEKHGFVSEILPQNKLLDSAHYRFDVRLTRQNL